MNGSKLSMLLAVALAASFAFEPAATADPELPPVPATAPAPAAVAEPTPAPPASSGPRGQMQGSAQLRRNVPIVGAVVKARRTDDASELRVTTTDVRGAFKFNGLSDGRYQVEVAREGFTTVVKDGIELRAPYRAVVEVIMAKAAVGSTGSPQAATGSPEAAPVSLRGVVRDKDGRVSGEVRVRIIRDDGSEDPREAVTTAQGEFAFDNLATGGWRLDIQGAGTLPLRTTIALSQTTMVAAVLVPQPADFPLAIEDLMPREEPIPPR